jgi:hypothetical protein
MVLQELKGFTFATALDPRGLTKRTLCGIILFKLNTFFAMFLRVPSIDSTCFLHT